MQFWQVTGLFLTWFGRQKMMLFYTTYKVWTILAGFEGLVKRTVFLLETILRGLCDAGAVQCTWRSD